MGVRGLRLADRNDWLVPLFLAIGVLLPTGGVLWFMNQAARSQAQAARQSVQEAYRAQLHLLRDRLDEAWQAKTDALDRPAVLPEVLAASGADGVILLDNAGQVRYPPAAPVPSKDPLLENAEWQAAMTLEQSPDLVNAASAYLRMAAAWKAPATS